MEYEIAVRKSPKKRDPPQPWKGPLVHYEVSVKIRGHLNREIICYTDTLKQAIECVDALKKKEKS